MIGFISLYSPEAPAAAANLEAFRRGLAEQNLVDGDSVVVESRYSDGRMDRVPALAQELVERGAAVLIVGTHAAARAAQGAVGATPVVFAQATDALENPADLNAGSGEANLTGIANVSDLDPKRLRLLDALVAPGARIAYVSDPNLGAYARDLAEIQETARQLGRPLLPVRAGNDTELAIAYKKLSGSGVGGLIVSSIRGLRGHPEKVVELAAKRKLPAIYFDRSFVDAGGLMSYGASFGEVYRLAGTYAGRILGGAQPRDLPVVDPHAVELVVNLNTARVQGLTIPQRMIGEASQTIG